METSKYIANLRGKTISAVISHIVNQLVVLRLHLRLEPAVDEKHTKNLKTGTRCTIQLKRIHFDVNEYLSNWFCMLLACKVEGFLCY